MGELIKKIVTAIRDFFSLFALSPVIPSEYIISDSRELLEKMWSENTRNLQFFCITEAAIPDYDQEIEWMPRERNDNVLVKYSLTSDGRHVKYVKFLKSGKIRISIYPLCMYSVGLPCHCTSPQHYAENASPQILRTSFGVNYWYKFFPIGYPRRDGTFVHRASLISKTNVGVNQPF